MAGAAAQGQLELLPLSAPGFLCGGGQVHRAIIFKPNLRLLNRAPENSSAASSMWVPRVLLARGEHRWVLHLKTHLLMDTTP